MHYTIKDPTRHASFFGAMAETLLTPKAFDFFRSIPCARLIYEGGDLYTLDGDIFLDAEPLDDIVEFLESFSSFSEFVASVL